MHSRDVRVILENVRSSENVGSVFRTADAAGVSKIYLTGYTPAPLDRFKRKNAKLAKAALGAENTVPWEHAENIRTLIGSLRNEGVRIVSVEQSPVSVSYTELRSAASVAFIFGNEVEGVSEETLSASDCVIDIPMHGKKESLNVSVCAGIILFHTKHH